MRVNVRSRRFGLLVGAGICAAALAGCGSSGSSKDDAGSTASHSPGTTASPSAGSGSEEGKPASKVLADAKSALFNAKAVHISGKVTTAAGAGVNLDMQFQGQDAEGSVSLDGNTVQIVKTNGQVFIEAPTAFWSKTAGSKGAALGGKWIKVDAKSAGSLGSLSLQGVAASLNASGAPLKPTTTTDTVDGRKAIVVTQKDGSKLYVDDSDNPVPLKIVNAGNAKGTLRFTGYDRTRHIQAPAHALTPKQAARAGGVTKT